MTSQRKRWPWIFLFVSVILIITTLATSWNWVLARERSVPWVSAVLGTLGFSALIVFFALFFAKILREMKLNQLQKDFLANMTHELQTPLASLELSASLLKKGAGVSDEDRRVLWSTHDSELHRLRDEVDRLLIASRWEQFNTQPQFKQVGLERWLQNSLVSWQRMLPASARLSREGESFENIVAALDVSLLSLITSNLIDNAKKFSGDKSPRIVVRTKRLGNVWSLRFEDDGLGFRAGESSKIFKRFQRLKQRGDHAIPGTGLGLHLALSASLAMGLELTAASDGPDRGAHFTLRGRILDLKVDP